ncbi:carbohydrate ABC transporter permease, partial [Streptomyces sp. SID11726]|nr:carbohydrate ABC transporter permease [Streptomyces sp. SID11726]
MSVAEKAPETGTRPDRVRAPRFTDEHGRRVRVWELVLRYVLLIAVLALTVGP